MERRIIHIHGQLDSGKTSALLSLFDCANAASVRQTVFISHNFDELLEVKHQLLVILDGLDERTTASVWQDSGVPVTLLVGAGLSSELTPAAVSAFDLPDQVDSPAAGAGQPRCLALLRSLIRFALRQIDSLISLWLSLVGEPDYPVSEFLIERKWFLLHGTHPPRLF